LRDKATSQLKQNFSLSNKEEKLINAVSYHKELSDPKQITFFTFGRKTTYQLGCLIP